MTALTAQNLYARAAGTKLVGAEGVARLGAKRVAVVGAGNIGGQVAPHLAALGIPLTIVDRDVVEPANLAAQGFAPTDLGERKAGARARALANQNPACRVDAVQADILRMGLAGFRGAALLIGCLDNRTARLALNEMAMRQGIPWIDCAIDGSGDRVFARVAAYDTKDQDCGCYLCPHDAESVGSILREQTGGGCAAWDWRQPAGAPAPTLAIPAAGGLAASIAAVWAVKILLGRGAEVAGREAYLDLDDLKMTVHSLPRNQRCLLDHRPFSLAALEGGAGSTIAASFDRAERALGPGVVFELERRLLATRLRCPSCGVERRPFRVLDAIAEHEALCGCGVPMQLVAADLLGRFGRAQAGEFLERSWSDIGLPANDVVVASLNGEEKHYLIA